MKHDFIEQKIEELAVVSEMFRSGFGDMDANTMNFKPDARVWSINQCLDHIIQTNRKYYGGFESIESGTYEGGKWARIPILPRLLGRLVVKVVSPDYKRKTKTSPLLHPSRSEFSKNMTSDLLAENDVLAGMFRKCESADPDGFIVSSPVNGLVTYSLRDCFTLLVEHEKRHYNQAARLKSEIGKGV